MKSIYDGPFTLDELVEFAKKRREDGYQHYAHHLCSVTNVNPIKHGVARCLHREPCEDNLDAIVRWLKQHVDDPNILTDRLELQDCICLFESELHDKTPTNNWGGNA